MFRVFLDSQLCQQINSIAGNVSPKKEPVFRWHAKVQHWKTVQISMQYNFHHEFVMHVTLEMLLFKVSYNRHAPKLLHLGALTFDRCWPWWSKAVLPCIRHRCGELQKMGLPALGLWLSTKASSRCSQKQGTIWYILCTGFRCQYQLGTRIIIRVQLPNVQYLRVQAMTYLSKSAIQDWPGCAKFL